MSSRPADCAAGDEALARGAWEEARDAFERALQAHESPEALEGLGVAAWWLDLADAVFDARERAYRLFLERDDRSGAARVAVWLAWDYWAFRGEHAVGNGWLQRARRLLDGFGDCTELAWLESREGAMALFDEGDPDIAHRHATEAIRVARAVRSIDLEMLGRAVQGVALVSSGAVAEGMRDLDEVNTAVLAGEMKDLVAIALSSCYLIAACERVRDYDRALQWCSRLKVFAAKWGLRPLFSVCRTQYASICMWRGTWGEAEQELVAATEELAAARPGMQADSIVRLAEVRRRQGRLVEAAQPSAQSEPHGLAALGRAEIAFDRGDMRAAADLANRYLRRVELHNRTDRAAGLELIVLAHVGLGELDAARTALAELNSIAQLAATKPLKAAANLTAGYVALASGEATRARQYIEDAVDAFLETAAPFELARARLALARALEALDQTDEARREAERAIAVLTELHAELEISRAKAFIESLATAANSSTTGDQAHPASTGAAPAKGNGAAAASDLTKREVEVLKLVANGLS